MNDSLQIKNIFAIEFINYVNEMSFIFSAEDQSTTRNNVIITWPLYYIDLDLDY